MKRTAANPKLAGNSVIADLVAIVQSCDSVDADLQARELDHKSGTNVIMEEEEAELTKQYESIATSITQANKFHSSLTGLLKLYSASK